MRRLRAKKKKFYSGALGNTASASSGFICRCARLEALSERVCAMVEKARIVKSLGEAKLALPELVSAALAAHDRAKYLFTLLQSAKARADHPAAVFSPLAWSSFRERRAHCHGRPHLACGRGGQAVRPGLPGRLRGAACRYRGAPMHYRGSGVSRRRAAHARRAHRQRLRRKNRNGGSGAAGIPGRGGPVAGPKARRAWGRSCSSRSGKLF